MRRSPNWIAIDTRQECFKRLRQGYDVPSQRALSGGNYFSRKDVELTLRD